MLLFGLEFFLELINILTFELDDSLYFPPRYLIATEGLVVEINRLNSVHILIWRFLNFYVIEHDAHCNAISHFDVVEFGLVLNEFGAREFPLI